MTKLRHTKVADNRSAAERQLEEDNRQPWRCVGCGMAVRPHTNQPCKCPAIELLFPPNSLQLG